MIGTAVRAFRWRGPWSVALGLAGSQAGHLLVYLVRFGVSAPAVQGTGVHAYFPALAGTAFALAGAALVVAVAVIGVARLAGAPPYARLRVQPGVIDMIAILFTLQLAIFATQETAEWLQAGAGPQPAVVVWGIAGQLPVALVAGIALRLVSARLEMAVAIVAGPRSQASPPVWLAVLRVAVPAAADDTHAQVRASGAGSRGPPAAAPQTV